MKYSIKSTILGGAMLFALSMSLTSCEGTLDDIFGEWDKPSTVPSTVVEEAGVLGAALKTGAKVAITYTVTDGTTTKTYKATFTKNSDDTYTLDSNEEITASGARAMTRSASPYIVPTGRGVLIGDRIILVSGPAKLLFSVSSSANVPLFKAELRIDNGEVNTKSTNGAGISGTITGVDVNNEKANVQIPEKLSVNITVDEISYAVKFSEGDTWADVAESNKENDMVKIAAITDDYISVNLSKAFVVSALKAEGEAQDDAEDLYNSTYSDTFYLIIDAYVQASDAVDKASFYTLTTTIPGTIDLSTLTENTYTVTKDVILTGTPTASSFTIKYGGDYEVMLDNVIPDGTNTINVDGNDHNINIKLKGTSRLKGIVTDETNYTVTIGEAAAGGTVIVKGADYAAIIGKTVTINGGTVKAKGGGEDNAVYTPGAFIINGGALYLAAGIEDNDAVSGSITLGTGVTLYGWDGSDWISSSTGKQYVTTDNNSGDPDTDWTW
jgi:hypothetical protein